VRALRRYLIVVIPIALVVLINAFAVSVNPLRRFDPIADYSTHRVSPLGCRAWLRLLEHYGYPVRRVEEPLNLAIADFDQLWVVDPTVPLAPAEAPALHRWVEDGGVLICAMDELCRARFFAMAASPEESASGTASAFPELADIRFSGEPYSLVPYVFQSDIDAIPTKEVPCEADVPFGDDVSALLVARDARIAELGDEWTVLVEDDEGIILAERPVGEGKVVATANADLFANRFIDKADNAVLTVNIAHSAGPGGAIGIDEYHHGFRTMTSLSDVILGFSGRYGLLEVAVLALIALGVSSRRFGSAIPLVPPSRRSALEHVDSMAGLYSKAAARTAAVAILRRAARRRLAKRAGLPLSAPEPEVIRAAAARGVIHPAVVQGVLRRAGEAERACECDAELVDVARQLEAIGGSSGLYGRHK